MGGREKRGSKKRGIARNQRLGNDRAVNIRQNSKQIKSWISTLH